MLHIMHTVLERALDLKARSFSESHLQKVSFLIWPLQNHRSMTLMLIFLIFFVISQILHLIGYALQEQESAVYPNMMFHERATKKGILAALEELINSPRVSNTLFIYTNRIFSCSKEICMCIVFRWKLIVTSFYGQYGNINP